jgi:hypothetical protein
MKGPFRKIIQRYGAVILIACALLWLPTAAAHAGGDEKTVARNFLSFVGSSKAILSSEALDVSLLDSTLSPVVVGYLFHLQDGGYLLVSGDRTISPVKAYSLTHDFAALPEPYRQALLAELELRVRAARTAAAHTGRAPLDAGTSDTEARWNFLLGFTGGGRMPLAYAEGNALVQTLWNQIYPYNKFMPQVGGTQPVYAGCVNVALAQVMRYHKHPAASKGVLSYTWNGPPSQMLRTILYRTYNWDNMPTTVDGSTPQYQSDEVALLMRDLGIANLTNFGISSSGTSLNRQALQENFGYSTSLLSMDNSDYAPFLAKIQSEIRDEARPVMLSFPGHMTVADGYRSEQTGYSVHVNMGWGGTENNFYFLDSVEDIVNAGGYSFSTSAGKLHIYYNIKPCNGSITGDCATNLETGDGINGLAISGKFDREWDTDVYEVYLKGPTTISANRGYSSVAFYVSILRADDGTTVFTLPDEDLPGTVSVGDLAAGKYIVRASLCSTEGACYQAPDPGFADYTVTLTSSEPTAQEKAAIDQGQAKAPIIGSVAPESPLPDLLLKTTGGTRRILIDARDENGDLLALSVENSNPAAVGVSWSGDAGNVLKNVLELTPAGPAKISSRITVTATAGGQTTTKTFVVLTDSEDTAFGKSAAVGGSFADLHEVVTHRVILDGTCAIAGSRPGYFGQALFLKVYDAAGVKVAPTGESSDTDSPIVETAFSRQVHRIEASPCSSTGICYTTPGIDVPYAITISCPGADITTATIANLLGISLTGAGLPFVIPGDIDGDGFITLADAVLTLQILSSVDTTGKTIKPASEVSGDQRVGLAEAIFVMQAISGLRNP